MMVGSMGGDSNSGGDNKRMEMTIKVRTDSIQGTFPRGGVGNPGPSVPIPP
jgi:hypothetical protein